MNTDKGNPRVLVMDNAAFYKGEVYFEEGAPFTGLSTALFAVA